MYLHAFNVLAFKWDNTIAYFTQKPFSSSVLLVAAKTMQGAPFAGFQDTVCQEYHHQLLQLFHMQHLQVCTNQCQDFRCIYTHQYVHPQSLRARTSSSTFGTCQERLQQDRDKRVPTDHTHKQTPFACVRNYVLAYKAPVCTQMVVITGYYYHLSLIPYTGYSVQIPHLQFVHCMLVMKVFTNLSQSHSVPSGACPMLLSPSCLHLHSSAAPP